MTLEQRADKLSPTMADGLLRMHRNITRRKISFCFAEPNDNTGRALVARGLLEPAKYDVAWNFYSITPLGYQVVEVLAARAAQ